MEGGGYLVYNGTRTPRQEDARVAGTQGEQAVGTGDTAFLSCWRRHGDPHPWQEGGQGGGRVDVQAVQPLRCVQVRGGRNTSTPR